MSAPKPAPSKPLSFRPPEMLKGETRSSELPYVEEPKNQHRRADGFREVNKALAATGLPEAKVTGKMNGLRPNVTIIDELHNGEDSIELVLGYNENQAPKPEKPKKPFVLDERLTQRPFHDDRLMQLKNRLQRPSFKNR